MKTRLTSDYLLSIGFKVVSETGTWIDFEKDGVVISSDMGINGGGFNCNLQPVNTVQELEDILYRKRTMFSSASTIPPSDWQPNC